ncbi:hypothetical protein LPJ70_007705, partial [Coemansia sp. RSA 2708]
RPNSSAESTSAGYLCSSRGSRRRCLRNGCRCKIPRQSTSGAIAQPWARPNAKRASTGTGARG